MAKKVVKKLPSFDYKCETICNDRSIYPVMRVLVEEYELSIRAASRHVAEDSGGMITAKRAQRVYENRHPAPRGAKSKTNSIKPNQQKTLKMERTLKPVIKGDPPHPMDTPTYANLRRLHKQLVSVSEGLQFLMDGEMKPESEVEVKVGRSIRKVLASLVFKAGVLGIDVEGIYQDYVKGVKDEQAIIDNAIKVG